jgi:hypothetical protein
MLENVLVAVIVIVYRLPLSSIDCYLYLLTYLLSTVFAQAQASKVAQIHPNALALWVEA